jgi:hypothetical protein
MATLLGENKIDSGVVEIMRQRGGTWHCYQNQAMDSAGLGHLQFLQCGPGRTFVEPPDKMPDTQHAISWKYLLVGKVNLETGSIE